MELFFGYWQSFLVGRVDDEPESRSATMLHLDDGGSPELTRWHSHRGSIFPTSIEIEVGHRGPSFEGVSNVTDISARAECIRTTNHLSVTCPFWTRFMLKPTVGIELDIVSARRLRAIILQPLLTRW